MDGQMSGCAKIAELFFLPKVIERWDTPPAGFSLEVTYNERNTQISSPS